MAVQTDGQRPVLTTTHAGKTVEYIEVTQADIAVANELAHQVLGRSLDELPPQTRRFLVGLDELVSAACDELKVDRADYRFTRRQVREHGGWSSTQTRVHLERLVELEYVLAHRGGRGQSFVYELLFDGKQHGGAPHLDGLIDPTALGATGTTSTWRGSDRGLAGSWRPQNGPMAGGWRTPKNDTKPSAVEDLRANNTRIAENALQGEKNAEPSYVVVSAVGAK